MNIKSSRRLLVLALVSSAVLSTFGTYSTSAIQQTPEGEAIANAKIEAAKAQNALDFAQAAKSEAERITAELKDFTNFQEPDRSSLQTMERLARTVDSMFRPGSDKPTLQRQVQDAKAKLSATTPNLTAAKTKLAAVTPSSDNITNATNSVQAKADAIEALSPTLDTAVDNLNTALTGVYEQVIKVADKANAKLTPFKTPAANPKETLTLFQTKLADVPALMEFAVDLQESWKNLAAKLENVVPATTHTTEAGKVQAQLTTLTGTAASIAQNLNLQMRDLAALAGGDEDNLFKASESFRKAPITQERVAMNDIKEAQVKADTLEKISRITASISALAESSNLAGFDKKATDDAQNALIAGVVQLRRQASAFQELLSGDRSLWVTEKIRLYYFTDIPRLIQTLNPEARLAGGDADARRAAQARLVNLREAEDAQSEANANVASIKRRLINIRQQLQKAQADLNLANIRASQAARKDTLLNRKPEKDVTAAQKEDSTAEKTRTEEDRKAAQNRVDALNDTQTGLAAQQAKAEEQLEIAQQAFEEASSRTIRAAQAESAAFANARDNTPFWFAPGVATSTDPAKRVEITSSTGGENAIFIRGARADITKVQDIVAKLDEPAPQARMTLWKIELNSDATEKGAERFNKALEIVENELATTRGNIADTLSLFLGAVSEEADYAASKSNIVQQSDRKDCAETRLYAEYFPNPGDTDISGRFQRLRRYSLYSPQVRRELGVEFLDELGFDNPKQFGLKDPGSATTLNEALIVTLLTDSFHRGRIMQHFQDGMKKFEEPGNDHKAEFTRLASMLRDGKEYSGTELATTRQQQELIYAMRNPLLRHLVGRLAHLQERVNKFKELYAKNNGKTSAPFTSPDAVLDADLVKCLQRKLPKIFDTIHDEFPISPVDIMENKVKLVDTGEGTIGLQLLDNEQPAGPPKVYNLRASPARVAAADGMLDVYTKAFEDDIDRVFVRPMLARLREKLKKTGIGFGVIQRTSVLATNRLVARVDPRATAELAVGQETNLIQGLQQLAQIALDARAGNIAGVFGQFGQIASEKDPAEIYGITSGSAFQVTPIFDPTGQALRFKFDFVDTTLVREPRGTTNPRIPRIERHTVNTEVQLANLELREVSRFESDAKIGLPTTYKGGLPILREIPGVRPIPLIGWFIRRKGSNAIAQRSLIFAQTTMSPTIGDILDLFDTSLQRR
ncbi:MAG TPA: hypothetical protein VN644_07665 [Pyrinomonadaceae bacterium]|nr:hypothetical protein [Pyrinomonadaceae bacterium]